MSELHPSSGYEKRDTHALKIAGVAILSIVILGGIIIMLDQFFVFTKEDIVAESLKSESPELREIRARDHALLNSYAVVDSSKGVYRIPIERAMQLMVEEEYKKTN